MKIQMQKRSADGVPVWTSIQMKIVLIYLCTIIIIMLVSGTFIVYQTEENDFKEIQQTMENMSLHIASRNFDIKESASTISESYEMYTLDQEGKVIDRNTSELKIGEKVTSAVVVAALVTNSEETSELRHFSSILNKDGYVEHARPTLDGNIIYIRTNTHAIYNKMLNIIRTIVMGLVLAMVITGFCGITFSNMITAPIKALTANSKKLAAGNTISRIPVEAADEIGELTQSFNYMASQLSATMEVVTSEKNKLEKIFEHMAGA